MPTQWPSPYGAYTWDEQAAFKWRTQFNSTFIGNSVAMTPSPSTEVTQVDAELANTIPTVDGPRTGACTGSSHREPTGSGRLAPSLITDPTAAKEILDIRVLDSVLLDLPNCSRRSAQCPILFRATRTSVFRFPATTRTS